jgi:hypothetical protein
MVILGSDVEAAKLRLATIVSSRLALDTAAAVLAQLLTAPARVSAQPDLLWQVRAPCKVHDMEEQRTDMCIPEEDWSQTVSGRCRRTRSTMMVPPLRGSSHRGRG